MYNGIFSWAVYIIGGYFLGGIMFSRILPKMIYGRDVTKVSDDRNPGAANVFMHCGVAAGFLCLALDMLKGAVPVYAALRALDFRSLLFAAVMTAPVFGHATSPFKRSGGGKCIATSFGVLIGILPVTPVVFVLAGAYIVFSTVIKINPNRRRSIAAFLVFGSVSAVLLCRRGMFSVALGCTMISIIAIIRNIKKFCMPEVKSEKLAVSEAKPRL